MGSTTHSNKSLNVIVVGGSLGGLFAGIVLKRGGHNVRILERNPTPLLHNQGAGLVAGSDTQEFFEKYDSTRTPIALTSPLRQYLDSRGNTISVEHWAQRMTSWDLLYYVMRANFDSLESGYCTVPGPGSHDGQATYSYGCTVTAVEDKPASDASSSSSSSIEVQYSTKDGTSETALADLVIGADGPSSTIRTLVEPQVSRDYAGYVAWRGTVPEHGVSDSTQATLVEKFTFFHSEGVQFLCYLIPGQNGSMQRGERLLNWVWYCNYDANSPEYTSVMTDSAGIQHNVTLPVGTMSERIFALQKTRASHELPPQFEEVVHKTQAPFIQAITDVISPHNAYMDGRLLLLGDAAAGFRPHTAASTSQAAFYALRLAELLDGEISLKEWERRTMQYSRDMQAHGVRLGERSQFGKHPLADNSHPMGTMAPVR